MKNKSLSQNNHNTQTKPDQQKTAAIGRCQEDVNSNGKRFLKKSVLPTTRGSNSGHLRPEMPPGKGVFKTSLEN